MTDKEILKSLRKGKNEKPIKQLYLEFSKIKKMILKNGGSEDMAKELFNDSLVLLIEKVRKPGFILTSKLTTFLYGINHYLMKNELRKQKKHNYEIEWDDTLSLPEEGLEYDFEKEEKLNSIEKTLDVISQKCKEILRLFYFQKENMKTIAEKLGFSSVNSAKTQKYKCIERASKIANQLLNSNS